MVATEQTLPRRCFENIVDAFTRKRRAFKVLLCADAFADVLAFVRCKEFLGSFAHFFLRDWVVAEILLEADEDDRYARATFENFGMPGVVISEWLYESSEVSPPYHFVVMFCRESGLEMEKAMRITWAWL